MGQTKQKAFPAGVDILRRLEQAEGRIWSSIRAVTDNLVGSFWLGIWFPSAFMLVIWCY